MAGGGWSRQHGGAEPSGGGGLPVDGLDCMAGGGGGGRILLGATLRGDSVLWAHIITEAAEWCFRCDRCPCCGRVLAVSTAMAVGTRSVGPPDEVLHPCATEQAGGVSGAA